MYSTTSTHKLPFILTNSATWGIGEAERVIGGKIRITSNIRHDVSIPIDPTESAVLCLVDHLEKLIRTEVGERCPLTSQCCCKLIEQPVSCVVTYSVVMLVVTGGTCIFL